MRFPWAYHRCVLCLRVPDPEDKGTCLTYAHIIPESVGGRLAVKFLCFCCNSLLGRTVEKGLKADPSIASCIKSVLSQLTPTLRRRMLKGMSWLADTGTGAVVEGRLDAKERFHPSESSDFLSHENAKAMLESRRQEIGLSEDEADEQRELLEAVPSSAFIHLPKGGPPTPVDPSSLTGTPTSSRTRFRSPSPSPTSASSSARPPTRLTSFSRCARPF